MKTKTILAAFMLFVLTICSCTKSDPEPKKKDLIKTSNEVTVTTFTYNSSTRSYYANISWKEITGEVVQEGVCLLYEKVGSQWIAWNYSIGTTNHTFAYGVGGIELLIEESDDSVPENPNSTRLKIIVIPPSQVRKIDHSDYETVKKEYHLSE